MWRIRVYENSHYQDEDEAYDLKEVFETVDAAILRAKQIVDASLRGCARDGADAAAILSCYRMWGDDPVVSGPDPSGFSAWTYAADESVAIAARGRT